MSMMNRLKEMLPNPTFVEFVDYEVPHDGQGADFYNEQKMLEYGARIVKECLDQCYHRGMNDELYEGQLKAAAYIEEHFGVNQ
jgi:hypothetical protein